MKYIHHPGRLQLWTVLYPPAVSDAPASCTTGWPFEGPTEGSGKGKQESLNGHMDWRYPTWTVTTVFFGRWPFYGLEKKMVSQFSRKVLFFLCVLPLCFSHLLAKRHPPPWRTGDSDGKEPQLVSSYYARVSDFSGDTFMTCRGNIDNSDSWSFIIGLAWQVQVPRCVWIKQNQFPKSTFAPPFLLPEGSGTCVGNDSPAERISCIALHILFFNCRKSFLQMSGYFPKTFFDPTPRSWHHEPVDLLDAKTGATWELWLWVVLG